MDHRVFLGVLSALCLLGSFVAGGFFVAGVYEMREGGSPAERMAGLYVQTLLAVVTVGLAGLGVAGLML